MPEDPEEVMKRLDLEYELEEYFIQCRETDINKLTPKSTFKINMSESKLLPIILKEKKVGFRSFIRDVLIKAYSTYKIDSERADLISKVKEVFSDVKLDIKIPETIKIDSIKGEKHEGKIITFPCEILQVEEPETITVSFLFRCTGCGYEQSFTPNSGRHVCDRCNEDMRNEGVAESETVRTITVQDINSADNNPVLFVTDFHKELTGLVEMNQKLMLTGVFKSIPPTSRNKHKNEILIDVINITSLEEDKTKKPDPLTIQMYKDLAETGKLIDKLVASYAWHIEGYEPLKTACLLYLARGVEEKNHRGRIHIFFLGDPSSAKSEIAKWMVRITHNSSIVDGTSSSGVGLGAGMVTLPNGRTGMVSGPLVRHNNGFVFIDEIDKMDKEKYEMLLGIMEEGRCRRTLAGVDIDLPASTSIIVCANPIGSLWDLENPSVGANINLKAHLLSRADLLFRSLQIPNEENDKKIGRHIIKSRHERPKGIFSEEELTAYFNYIRELKPAFPEESEEKILDFFSKREKFQLGRDSVPMDWRQYEALGRLAYAFAKLLLKHTVDEECVNRSIDIFKKAVESFGISLEDGGSTAESSKWFVSPKESKDRAFRTIFKKIEESNGMVFREDLVEEMSKIKQWKSKEQANATINILHSRGEIIEKQNGEFKLVD